MNYLNLEQEIGLNNKDKKDKKSKFRISMIRLDLKICWLAITRFCFFENTQPAGKKFF